MQINLRWPSMLFYMKAVWLLLFPMLLLPGWLFRPRVLAEFGPAFCALTGWHSIRVAEGSAIVTGVLAFSWAVAPIIYALLKDEIDARYGRKPEPKDKS